MIFYVKFLHKSKYFSVSHFLNFFSIFIFQLLLRPLKPYSPFDSNITGKFRTESVGDLMHVVSFISKDVMNVEAARRLSFYRWPHNNFK